MCKNSVRWVYRLDKNFTWNSEYRVAEDLIFRDKTGIVRLIIETSGAMTVTRGYAWNGCSPKVCVWALLIGTPDGVVHARTGKPKTYFASLIHDALYQFLPDGLPLGRRQVDGFFLRLLAESDFAPRWCYWVVVRSIGGIVWRATRQTRQNRGTRQIAGELKLP